MFSHASVLPEEVLGALDPRPGGIVVDGTLGGCGHALSLLERIGPGGRLIGFDIFENETVSNIENFKRRRTLHPFGSLDLSSKLFFERALHVKRGGEFVFLTKSQSRHR